MADVLRPRKRPQRIEDEARIGEGSTRSPDNVTPAERQRRERAASEAAKDNTEGDANAGYSSMFLDAVYGDDKPDFRKNGGKTTTDDRPVKDKDKPKKKAKGGMISTKRYMNGGMVMSGRGVRDTKMS